MIRTLWVYVVAGLLTLRYGLEIVYEAWRGSPRLRRVCECNPRRWARKILRAAGVDVRLEGLEHLERGRAQILVSNHESWFDVFALAAHLPVRYQFVAKRELEGVPVFGRAWLACGHVSLDRGDRASAIGALSEAGRRIHEEGLTVVVFPEGTRSPTGELQPFKKGAFMLALQSGAPLVPMAIRGSRAVMPKGSWRIRPGRIEVRVGEPHSVAGLAPEDRDALIRRVRSAVVALRGGDPTHP